MTDLKDSVMKAAKEAFSEMAEDSWRRERFSPKERKAYILGIAAALGFLAGFIEAVSDEMGQELLDLADREAQ